MSNKFSKLYISRAFQNGIASQNILIFVGTSSVDVKKYILEKCKKKGRKKLQVLLHFYKYMVHMKIVTIKVRGKHSISYRIATRFSSVFVDWKCLKSLFEKRSFSPNCWGKDSSIFETKSTKKNKIYP